MSNQSHQLGRPQLSAIEKERREAARRLQELEKVKDEFNKQLGLTASRSEEEREEIIKLAEARRKICAAIDKVSEEVKAARESGNNQEEMHQKGIRKALYDKLNELPELGYTYAEWDEAPQSMKERELGRPKLRIEQRLNRAQDAYEEQESIVREIEQESNIKPADISSYIREAIQPGVGRPRLDSLDRMDREIVKIDEDIAFITSGEAQKEQDEALRARMEKLGVDDPSKLPGRPPVDIGKKLKRLRDKKEDLLSQIADREAKMSDLERAERTISKIKLNLRNLRRKMKKADGSERVAIASEIESQEDALKYAEMDRDRIQEVGQINARRSEERETGSEESATVATTEKVQDKQAEPESTSQVKQNAKEKQQAKIQEDLGDMSSILDEMIANAGMKIKTEEGEDRPRRSSLMERLEASKAVNE